MLKKLMITTALTGFMIGGALAEGTPSTSPSSPASPPAATTSPSSPTKDLSATTSGGSTASSVQVVNSQKPDQWLASKFKGTDVVGNDNEKIGDVSDILFDKSGKVEAFIVGVGGFLGIGSKDVAIPPNSFQVVAGDKSKNESDKLKLSMTKDQLKQAANFEPYNPPRATTGSASPGGMNRPAPAAPAAR
jgi:sporulation protein YlmC with PRC-barrel domain